MTGQNNKVCKAFVNVLQRLGKHRKITFAVRGNPTTLRGTGGWWKWNNDDYYDEHITRWQTMQKVFKPVTRLYWAGGVGIADEFFTEVTATLSEAILGGLAEEAVVDKKTQRLLCYPDHFYSIPSHLFVSIVVKYIVKYCRQ